MQKSYGNGKRTIAEEQQGMDLLIPNLTIDLDSGKIFWKTPNSKQRKLKPGDVAGCKNKKGYHYIKFNGSNYRRHRIIFYAANGYLPEIVDHIRGVEYGDGISNLRDLSQSLNSLNRKVPSTNCSGYIGVSEHTTKTKGRRWRANLTIGGEKHYLGIFDTPEQAHIAVNDAAKTYNIKTDRRNLNV